MAQIYIINKQSFVGFEDLSVNIEEVRLKVFIKKAQDLDLKPFFGAVFFSDFITSLVFNTDGTLKPEADGEEGTPQKYIDLIEGKVYQNKHGKKLVYDGLTPALIYWTFARFIEADAVRYTATGPVVKHHEDADSLKLSDTMKLVQQQRSVANAHANDVILFLENNRDTYDLWRYNERNTDSRQPGPRIRGVDRTDVRAARNGYGNRGFGFFGDLIP